MFRIALVIFLSALMYTSDAQQSQACGFQSLFTFKPGMDKMAVLDSANKTYKLTIAKTSLEKLAPYQGSGGDSITKEVVAYNVDSSLCFKGRNSKLFLEFADDKLYKAYLVTEYPKSAFQDMVSNFNSLRGSIKPYWKYEKSIKLSGNNTNGAGFDYTKVKKATLKTEKVSLQYVDGQTNNPNSSYQLEVLWANLANTRMEGSNY